MGSALQLNPGSESFKIGPLEFTCLWNNLHLCSVQIFETHDLRGQFEETLVATQSIPKGETLSVFLKIRKSTRGRQFYTRSMERAMEGGSGQIFHPGAQWNQLENT